MKFHKDGSKPQNGEIFVFGSNLAGIHGGGAALAAKNEYGAINGKFEGLQGNSYAIPTKDAQIKDALPLANIQAAVSCFIEFAAANPEKQFFVTRIGCVLAGYSDSDIAPMFSGAPDNCSFAKEWEDHIKPAKTALVLRCCAADMRSRKGFIWPDVGGIATAPDWVDSSDCGNGLHGWLYGQGDHTTSDFIGQQDAKWLVVEVAKNSIRMLGGKCKFPSGKVVFVGGRKEAADYIIEHEPNAKNVAVIGAVLECGDKGILQGGALSVLTGGNYATMTGGDDATMTGGNYATMTGGYDAKMTGGDDATMTGGNFAKMTGGNFAKMTGGDYAKMTGGNYAKMTGGDDATMTGGNFAKMTGGDYAKMTGGNYAKMTGGDDATMTGGDDATMHFQYFDGKRQRAVVAYVGEDGVEANVAYKLDENHKVVKA